MESKKWSNIFWLALPLLLVAVASFLGLQKVFAESSPFEVSDVVVSQITDTATGSVTGFSANKINNNVTFHKIGDSVVYKITIKNTGSNSRIIDNVTSNYEGEIFNYEFSSFAGDEIAAGESFDFVLKTTYANAVTDVNERNQKLEIKVVFKFSDGSESTIVIANPSTWDNISVFGVIMAVCIIGLSALIIFRMKRAKLGKKVAIIGILLAVACLPLPFAEAADGVYDVSVDSDFLLNDRLIVKYMSADGEELLDSTIEYGDTVENIDAPEPDEGYYFAGWKTPDGEVFDFNTVIDDDLVLVASYEPYSYTIKFNGNKSTSGSMEEQTVAYDEAVTLTKNIFVRQGYTFAGWSTVADGSSIYSDEAEIKNLRSDDGTYELFAVWAPRTDTQYTVVRSFMTVDGDTYVSLPEEHYTGTTDTNATPEVGEYAGFVAPNPESVLIVADGSARVEYKYDRRQYRLTLKNSEYIESEYGPGLYNYEKEITLKAIDRDGWKFSKWSDGRTDREITVKMVGNLEIGPEYIESPFKTVYSHKGQCQFNGIYEGQKNFMTDANNITGDDCEEYYDVKYIDTGVKLFSQANIRKDFLITFTIDEFDKDKNGHRGTLMSGTAEIDSLEWPGVVVRRNEASANYLIGSNVTRYTDNEHTMTSRFSGIKKYEPISNTRKITIMRKNEVICYQVNNSDIRYMNYQPKEIYPFETTVYFGASYRWIDGMKTPMAYIDAKLSNMEIKLGEDVDGELDGCVKP